MASRTIKATKGGPKSVPQPENANFVLGSRPAVLRSPTLQRIKPDKASTTEYGKDPPLAGNTGMSGLS